MGAAVSVAPTNRVTLQRASAARPVQTFLKLIFETGSLSQIRGIDSSARRAIAGLAIFAAIRSSDKQPTTSFDAVFHDRFNVVRLGLNYRFR
jgi:hypothetical protein